MEAGGHHQGKPRTEVSLRRTRRMARRASGVGMVVPVQRRPSGAAGVGTNPAGTIKSPTLAGHVKGAPSVITTQSQSQLLRRKSHSLHREDLRSLKATLLDARGKAHDQAVTRDRTGDARAAGGCIGPLGVGTG